MDLVIKYRVAEAVRQREVQNALAAGCDWLEAINRSHAAYMDVLKIAGMD